jgi:hypothetical protein
MNKEAKINSSIREYSLYRRTPHWAALRQRAFLAHGTACQVCGKYNNRCEVHHIVYRRLFDVQPSDLLVLCPICHADYHAAHRACGNGDTPNGLTEVKALIGWWRERKEYKPQPVRPRSPLRQAIRQCRNIIHRIKKHQFRPDVLRAGIAALQEQLVIIEREKA